MRVLFTCLPESGHFHPVVPVARAARAAGHTVAFATAERMRPQVERLGFGFFPAGRPSHELRDARWTELLPTIADGSERLAFVRRTMHAGLRVASELPGVQAAADAFRPDLVVRDSLNFSGCLVAEARDIPHAAVEVWAVGGRMYRRDALAEPLNEWRAHLGLPPDPELAMLERYLTLVPFPRSFRPPGDPIPATAYHVRPGVFSESGDEQLPAWFAELPAGPIVHLTLGTFFNARNSALRAVVDGLAHQPLSLVIATGRDQDPAALGPLPPNVRAARYIPHAQLLPRCAAVISHVGAGTLTAALWHGLPQLALPLAGDQFANAHLLVRLGAGEQLAEAERTPARIASATSRLLSHRPYQVAARAVAAAMRHLPPIETAVPALERLATDRAPPGTVR